MLPSGFNNSDNQAQSNKTPDTQTQSNKDNSQAEAVSQDQAQRLGQRLVKSGEKKLLSKVNIIGALSIILLIAGASYAFKHIQDSRRAEREAQQAKLNSSVKTGGSNAKYARKEEKQQPKKFTAPDEPKEEKTPTTTFQGQRLGEKEQKQPQKLNKTKGDMRISGSSNITQVSPPQDNEAQPSSRALALTNEAIRNAQANLNDNGLNERLGGNDDIYSSPVFTARTATKSQYNSNLLLAKGTYIPCVLRNKLISNVSGQLSCTIAENVLSENGNVVLIEKGSRVNGYYQGGSVKHGSAQLFVIWQEVKTPNNVIIPLDSGSTDELGSAGLSGYVDNHFWDRFSNAIFLSMIRDFSGAVASRLSEQASSDTENTREQSEAIAQTVLEQMGDIPPTIYKNQGDKVGIFVSRDVDFSQVYELKIKDY